MADHRAGPRLKGVCPECGELRRLRAGGVLGTHKRIYRKYYRSSYPCKGTGAPARLYGCCQESPHVRAENENTSSGGTKIMTDQPAPQASPAVGTTEPRPQRRAVMHVSMPMLQQLLGLPDDVEVLHVAPGNHGLSLAVVLTHPDVPELPPECNPWTISPTLGRTADGRVRIASTGIEMLTGGVG